jgi:hypothetical protein
MARMSRWLSGVRSGSSGLTGSHAYRVASGSAAEIPSVASTQARWSCLGWRAFRIRGTVTVVDTTQVVATVLFWLAALPLLWWCGAGSAVSGLNARRPAPWPLVQAMGA